MVCLTDRRNALSELLSGCLIHQGFSGPLVELPGDGAELGLFEARMGGEFRSSQLMRDLCCYLPNGADADLEYPTTAQGLILHFLAAMLAGYVTVADALSDWVSSGRRPAPSDAFRWCDGLAHGKQGRAFVQSERQPFGASGRASLGHCAGELA